MGGDQVIEWMGREGGEWVNLCVCVCIYLFRCVDLFIQMTVWYIKIDSICQRSEDRHMHY